MILTNKQEYVWGGDALSFSDTNNIWIDHVTTSLTGRQHYSFGEDSNNAVTISNSFLDGSTTNSASKSSPCFTSLSKLFGFMPDRSRLAQRSHSRHSLTSKLSTACDGHTYWGLELVGSGDFITFYKNWVYETSGRSPALSGNTVFHAVNNVWSSNSGHLLEGTDEGKGLYEGNYFLSTPTIVASGFVGQLYSSESAYLSQCDTYLGRACVENLLGSGAGSFAEDDYSWFSDLSGRPIVAASSASSVATSVINNAGNTL